MSLYRMVLLQGILALPFPIVKILVFSALSCQRQLHSFQYAGGTLAFRVHIGSLCYWGVSGALFLQLKEVYEFLLRIIAWSSNICKPGRVSRVAMGMPELLVKDNSRGRNTGSVNYYLEFGYFLFVSSQSQAAFIKIDEFWPFIIKVSSEELIACTRLKRNTQEYQRVGF